MCVWVVGYLSMMMEEVSVMMAYDAQVMEQMSEEEILACLVAETGPKFTVRLTFEKNLPTTDPASQCQLTKSTTCFETCFEML